MCLTWFDRDPHMFVHVTGLLSTLSNGGFHLEPAITPAAQRPGTVAGNRQDPNDCQQM